VKKRNAKLPKTRGTSVCISVVLTELRWKYPERPDFVQGFFAGRPLLINLQRDSEKAKKTEQNVSHWNIQSDELCREVDHHVHGRSSTKLRIQTKHDAPPMLRGVLKPVREAFAKGFDRSQYFDRLRARETNHQIQ
jgi:hypothetical protein